MCVGLKCGKGGDDKRDHKPSNTGDPVTTMCEQFYLVPLRGNVLLAGCFDLPPLGLLGRNRAFALAEAAFPAYFTIWLAD